jgi:hypothetical protein
MLFSHLVVFLRPQLGVANILYNIITCDSTHERLIVFLPVGGRRNGVFLDGKVVGEFRSGQEARAYARLLVAQLQMETLGTQFRSDRLHADKR